MLEKIKKTFAEHPLAVSLLLAFIIRAVAAYRNYGPYAHDDFINVLEPALRHLFLGTPPDVPTLRFEILPYFFSFIMKPLYLLGVRRVDLLVSFGFFVLSLISLTQIVAAFRIGNLLFSEKIRNAFTLFSATWCFAPLFTNSVDIAAPSYILVSFGIYHLVRGFPEAFGINTQIPAQQQTRSVAFAGFYISAAIFFRFSLLPIYLGCALWLVWISFRNKTLIKSLALFALGGFVTMLIMFGFELASGRKPLSTALEFLYDNIAVHISTQAYGSMPWHTYIGISLLFPIPPLSLIFWPFMVTFARKFSGLTVIYLSFLISHSVLPFKLDRYVIPMVPIFMVFLFATIEKFAAKKLVAYSYRALIILNLILIVPVAVTMQQRAGVDGAIYAGTVKDTLFASKVDPWRVSYYGFQSQPAVFADRPEDIVKIAGDRKLASFHVYHFLYFSAEELAAFKAGGFTCVLEKSFRPDFLERVAIRLNPTMNGRRADTSVYRCLRE